MGPYNGIPVADIDLTGRMNRLEYRKDRFAPDTQEKEYTQIYMMLGAIERLKAMAEARCLATRQ